MYPTVPLAMFGWIPFVLWLFQRMPARRAAMAAFFLGWMFLPNHTYSFSGLPDYDKVAAASIGILLGTLCFARDQLASFKLVPLDTLMAFWCLTPVFASITNGLGLYDGFSAAKNYIMIWAVPYFIGRLYFHSLNDLAELAYGVFLGGLIYAPLCWIEIMLSPQLHNWIYGWHPHDFIQSIRGNSYRPVLFMQHGLMVGMWMASATLFGWQLWRTGTLDQLLPAPLKGKGLWLVLGLGLTFLASKSIGAILLLLVGGGLLWIAGRLRRPGLFLLLALVPLLYIGARTVGGWDAHTLVDRAQLVGEDRQASLEFRIVNESMLIEKALEQPVFGWGGWGRARIYDENGDDITVTDGFWIIVFGTTGLVAVATFLAIVLGPVLILVTRLRRQQLAEVAVRNVLPVAVLLLLYALDSLMNDMKNPVYMMIAGGIASVASAGFLTRNQENTPGEANLSEREPTLALPRYL